jgi:class 3 adenylate cyclase/tetratricopeptide (TPR) repeat protein
VVGEARSGGTITVLFTDLVGSTDLMARLGAEAFDTVRQAHFAALRGAIGRHGGEEVKNTGDGLMVTFGSVVDALRAAVAMQQATDRQARTGPAPISIRVGVSIGEVTFEDGDVFGTPVVEAARLAAAAGPGMILTTAIARALASGRAEMEFADLGPLELKGLPAPVPACEVLWPPAGPTVPIPALLTGIGRIFVGREGELTRLTELWKEAATGQCQLAVVAGEPGIGKTRLAAQLAQVLHSDGAVVLAGRCDEDLGVPYQPFVEALRHYVDHAVEPRLGRYGGELARLVPEIAQRAEGLGEPLRSDPETERYRLFDAVAAWLAAAAEDCGVFLVLDDLQWAAKPTLLLLRHVLRSSEAMRLLVVVTYRDSDIGPGHPLGEVLADLRRRGGVERLSLAGLDRAGVAAYIETAAGHAMPDEDDEAFVRAVWDETEGNPFFVGEVLRHLSESGAIEQRDGRWTSVGPVGELGIPDGVREVVGQRLSRLSATTNQALVAGAVIGLEFESAVVATASNLAEEALLVALDEALAARLLVEVPAATPRYRFSHALVRATLYDDLTAARRVALHRSVGEAIEITHGDANEALPSLAHHFLAAGDSPKAVHYATRAGERALAQLAHHDAAAYFARALDLANDDQRLELLISLGEAQRRAGNPASPQTLLDAAELAHDRRDIDALARATLANSRGILRSSRGVSTKWLRVAIDATGNDETPTRAELFATLALELGFTGTIDERVALSDEAVRIARITGDPATLTRVLISRCYAILSPATIDERQALSDELVAAADSLEDPATRARAWLVRARLALETGRLSDFDGAFTRCSALADEVGQPTLRWSNSWTRLGRALLAGHLSTAERLARETADIGRLAGQHDVVVFVGYHLFSILSEQDRLHEIEGLIAEAAAFDTGLGIWKPVLARLHLEMCRPEQAYEILDHFAAEGFVVPIDAWWWHTCGNWVAVCAALDHAAAAAQLHRQLAPYADQLGFPITGICCPAIAHHLGVLATTLGRWDEAAARFAAAATTHERIAAPIWLARTRLEWARMLLTRRQAGDPVRAHELLGPALDAARQLGASNIERQAGPLLQEFP